MLLFTLTKSSIIGQLRCTGAREFVIAPELFLTCAADGSFSRIEVADQIITVCEGLMGRSQKAEPNPLFLRADFSQNTHTAILQKYSASGRSLYYHTDGEGNFFASTHIRLLQEAGVRIEEDPAALPELLVYRIISPPRTFFRAIRQMPLAGRIIAQRTNDGWSVREEDYFPATESVRQSSNSTIDSVGEALNESLDPLRPSASRVATLLSGGLDSSVLSRIARDRLAACDTYSTSHAFDKAWNSEQQYALSAAAGLSTRHTLFAPRPADFLTGFIQAIADSESPLHHLQSVLLYLLFKHGIPEHLDCILCGEGADSAFGQDSHMLLRSQTSLRMRVGRMLPDFLLQTAGLGWPKLRHFSDSIAKAEGFSHPLSSPLNSIWNEGAYGDFDWVKAHCNVSKEEVIAPRLAYLQTLGGMTLPDLIAAYCLNNDAAVTAAIWSKLAESQGKVLYFPFIDERVLNSAFHIPWSVKLKRRKWVVHEIGRRLQLPKFILRRPKQSFGISSMDWAESGGPLEPLISLAARIVDIQLLRSLQGSDSRRAMMLWSYLNYAVLKRIFVLGEPAEALAAEMQENSREMRDQVSGSSALAVAS
jgi:asparagine synthetase B (glutamine-hydrolysing)